jgi:hypothetical protein
MFRAVKKSSMEKVYILIFNLFKGIRQEEIGMSKCDVFVPQGFLSTID